MLNLIFKNAEEAKEAIMDSQKKEIAALYEKWADEIGEKAKHFSHQSTASSVVSERQMRELQKMLKATGQEVSNEVYSKVKKNMYTIADAVVADNVKWLQSFGFSADGLNAAFNYVPDEIVRNLITGQIYSSGWSLSKRIWGDNEQTMKDAYQIMAKGLAENKSVYDIAKELEQYVRPSAKKPWNPVLAMKNTKTGKIEYKRIYKKQVDYNAQRLARTLAQHSYQQSFLATTQNNPFITEYIWRSNGSRVCDLCKARDGVHFKKNELPMDHPNGMCVMEPVVVKDMVDQLADWFNSPDGTYPEIDAFAGNFGYEAKVVGTAKDFIDKYGMSTKSPNAWYNSLTQIQKAEAKALKDQSGLTWEQWFKQNVYSGSGSEVKKAQVKEQIPTYLSKFTNDTVPKTYKDFYNKLSYDEAMEFKAAVSKAFGVDISSMPHSKAVKFTESYFKDVVLKQVSSNGIISKIDDIAAVAAKDATKTATTKAVASKIDDAAAAAAKTIVSKADDAFDAAKWYDSLRGNDLNEFENLTKEWLKTISTSEKNGVVTYTGNAYWDMNAYLRGRQSSTKYKTAIKNAESALAKASLPRETIVRRGADYNMLDGLGIGTVTSKNKSSVIGAIVQDLGFMSTSPAPRGGFTSMDIEYIIKLPKGSQAMYVDSISKHKGEEELLINKGGKFIVEEVEFDSRGNVNKIYMTLINLNKNKL